MTAKITSAQEKQFKRFVEDLSDRALTEIGPDKEGLQRLLERGGEFQSFIFPHVAVAIRRFASKTLNYDLARAILGEDFITPEEITTARSVKYSDEQLARLVERLPSQEVMEWCRENGFVLLATPPRKMSTLDIRLLKADLYYTKQCGWYRDKAQKFSRDDKTSDGWLMVKKKSAPNSRKKNWDEQNKLLSDVEHVPNAAEMCWFVTTFFEVRGVRLFSEIYVRTSSPGLDGRRVLVGSFGAQGLDVSDGWEGIRYSDVGLASARK